MALFALLRMREQRHALQSASNQALSQAVSICRHECVNLVATKISNIATHYICHNNSYMYITTDGQMITVADLRGL